MRNSTKIDLLVKLVRRLVSLNRKIIVEFQSLNKQRIGLQDLLRSKNEEIYLQENLIRNQENKTTLAVNRKLSLNFIKFIEGAIDQKELTSNNNFLYLLEHELDYEIINDPSIEFDPRIHEAINESESDRISQVVKFGYSFQGHVIRAAKVLLEDERDEER